MQLDKNGLIVTREQDGGDTCAEEGRYWFLYWFNFVWMSNFSIANKIPHRGHPEDIIPKLEVSPGVYVRNPDKNPPNPEALWETDPSTTSRDQLVPIIWYCAAYRDRARLLRLFWACLKRGMFAQNTKKNWNAPGTKLPDTMLISMGAFIRAGGWWTAILYPLLIATDLLDLLGTLLALIPVTFHDAAVLSQPSTWLSARNLGDVDDNNQDISILGAVAFKPTPISWLNRVIWGQFRPKNFGNTVLGIENNCFAAMAWYHDPRNQGNSEVVELYKAPLLKYLKKELR